MMVNKVERGDRNRKLIKLMVIKIHKYKTGTHILITHDAYNKINKILLQYHMLLFDNNPEKKDEGLWLKQYYIYKYRKFNSYSFM